MVIKKILCYTVLVKRKQNYSVTGNDAAGENMHLP
jgi:hypothetical protein